MYNLDLKNVMWRRFGAKWPKGFYLWFARVQVGLDEDLADADVLAHGPEGGLHGLSRPQDGHAGDLRRRGSGASVMTGTPADTPD